MRNRDFSLRLAAVVTGISAVLPGCGGGSGTDGGTVRKLQNEGRLCVFPASDPGASLLEDTRPRTYAGNEALDLYVVFPVCLSGSCTTDRTASCTVEQTGSTFVVNATASYRDVDAEVCTADCKVLSAHCPTPPVAEGTFVFQYADGSVDLVVPSSGAAPCVGTAPY